LQAVESFFFNFGQICSDIYKTNKENYEQIDLYFQGENRFGLWTYHKRRQNAYCKNLILNLNAKNSMLLVKMALETK
jgi:hypothetical protein